MKRTEHFGFALFKEEKARLRIMASDLHISMSALIRMRVFTKPAVQTWQSSGHTRPWEQKRKLSPIPGTPEHMVFEATQTKIEATIELKLRLNLPNKGLSPIQEEEKLADEVGIE